MSPAARRRIAAAQKARWAKWRKQRSASVGPAVDSRDRPVLSLRASSCGVYLLCPERTAPRKLIMMIWARDKKATLMFKLLLKQEAEILPFLPVSGWHSWNRPARTFEGPLHSQARLRQTAHLSDYKKAWQKAARDAGIPDRRIYDLRASFASRANACRASGLTIAHLLGHDNNTQILPTYVKPLDENTKAVIEALDAARASRSVKSAVIQ